MATITSRRLRSFTLGLTKRHAQLILRFVVQLTNFLSICFIFSRCRHHQITYCFYYTNENSCFFFPAFAINIFDVGMFREIKNEMSRGEVDRAFTPKRLSIEGPGDVTERQQTKKRAASAGISTHVMHSSLSDWEKNTDLVWIEIGNKCWGGL